jgi:hypothetical protein
LYRSQNCARSVPLESRQYRLAIGTSLDQIRVAEDPQPLVQKMVLKRPKTHQNWTKRAEQETREAHAAPSCVEQCGAAPCRTMLLETLYKYGSSFEIEERQIGREITKLC